MPTMPHDLCYNNSFSFIISQILHGKDPKCSCITTESFHLSGGSTFSENFQFSCLAEFDLPPASTHFFNREFFGITFILNSTLKPVFPC